MRVGIIGNMNNNGFALMRYFRDLGVDAHLLLFSDDGTGSCAHFAPEHDSWTMDRWWPYIHRLPVENGFGALIPTPAALSLPLTSRRLRRLFADFDQLIGSGLAPAILERCDRPLDVFFPYGIGIEFVDLPPFPQGVHHPSLPKRWAYRYVRRKQIDGIRHARLCFNTELSLTRETFERIGKKFLPLAIPMVYNGEAVSGDVLPAELRTLRARMEGFDLTVMHHARLMWVNPGGFSDTEWEAHSNKHNDWLLHGFAQFRRVAPDVRAALVILEYGPDVEATRRLVRDLDIAEQVIWLPKMPRKHLMQVLRWCDVGVGEFYSADGVICGGTGWEVLASGKPLLQRLNFSEAEFRRQFGHPPPPLLNARSPEEIARHLHDMATDPDRRATLGKAAREWFGDWQGAGLARRWLDAMEGVEPTPPTFPRVQAGKG